MFSVTLTTVERQKKHSSSIASNYRNKANSNSDTSGGQHEIKITRVPDRKDEDCQKQVPLGFLFSSCFVFNLDFSREFLQNQNNCIITTDRPNYNVWLQI